MANITIVATGGTRAPTQLDLANRFLADGHAVRCIASSAALRFLFSHMIRRPWKFPRFVRLFRPYLLEFLAYFREKPKSVPHISEGKWADVVVMVPATCNSVGKLVSGISDNYPLLTLRAVPRGKKVIVVPSMNPEMWYDPALQRNVDLLNATEKYRVLCPSRGQMLSGDWGIGAQVPLADIVTETYRALGLVDPIVDEVFAGSAKAFWQEREPEIPRPEVDIVLADGDAALTRELSQALRREYPHFRVHCFDTASEALTWLRDSQAALVFTELEFAGGASGHELIEECRRPGRPPLQLIATGSAQRNEVGAERLGRLDVLYVPKPVNLPYLVGMIAGSVQATIADKSRTPMARRRLAAGELLFREGERGNQVFVVQSGRLRIFRDQNGAVVELGEVGTGRMLGELAFFGNAVRAATVEAIEASELVELDLDHMRNYLERQPTWLRAMIQSLLTHLEATSERLARSSTREPVP